MNSKPDLSHLSGPFDNVVHGGPPPAGHYVARITSTEINTSKKGDLQVVYDLLIFPEEDVRVVKKFTPLQADRLYFLDNDMKILQEPLTKIADLPRALQNVINSIVEIEISYADEGFTFPIPRFLALVKKG